MNKSRFREQTHKELDLDTPGNRLQEKGQPQKQSRFSLGFFASLEKHRMPPTLRSEIRKPWNSVLAQQVKEPATTPDQLSSVFRTLWVEEKNRFPQVDI